MELWTKEHTIAIIPTFVVMAIVSILLGHFLKDKDERYKLIPIKIIAVIIIVLEIWKQIESFLDEDGYSFYRIPLHFCSLFVFFIPLFAFYKGKFCEIIRSFTTICCMMLFVFMCVYPNMIFSAGNVRDYFSFFIDFHTVTFHLLVCFAFMLILSLRLYTIETKRDMKIIIIGYSIYCVIAGIMAQVLKTNYNGFYRCNIDAIREIQESLISSIGWFGQFLFVLAMSIATIAFGYACYWLFRGIFALYNVIKNKLKKAKNE